MSRLSWWSDLTRPLVVLLTRVLAPYTTIPASTIFVLVLSTAISLIVSTVNRKVIDVEKMREYRKEVSEFMKDMDAVKESDERRAEARLKRREKKITQLQSWMMKQQLKLMVIFTIPFGILFPILNEVFEGIVIAYSPLSLPFIPRELGFFHWYLICSFGVNLPLSRVFGLSMGGED